MTSIGEYYYLKNKKLEAQFQESESKRAADENELNRKMRNIYYEALEKKNPDNIYYSLVHIKGVLKAFFDADRNLDGAVSRDELFAYYRPTDQKAVEELRRIFEASEKNGDGKLSLGEFFILGFIDAEQNEGYTAARKI